MYTNTVHEGEGLIPSETASSTWVCTCFSTERVKSCCTYTGNTSQPQATQQERCPDLCGVAPCARLKPHHRTLATVTHVKRTGAVLNCVLLQSLFQTVHCCSHCSKLCTVAVTVLNCALLQSVIVQTDSQCQLTQWQLLSFAPCATTAAETLWLVNLY